MNTRKKTPKAISEQFERINKNKMVGDYFLYCEKSN